MQKGCTVGPCLIRRKGGRRTEREYVCVLCMRLCVREKQSNMRLRDLGGQTLIPPGACWVSLQ